MHDINDENPYVLNSLYTGDLYKNDDVPVVKPIIHDSTQEINKLNNKSEALISMKPLIETKPLISTNVNINLREGETLYYTVVNRKDVEEAKSARCGYICIFIICKAVILIIMIVTFASRSK